MKLLHACLLSVILFLSGGIVRETAAEPSDTEDKSVSHCDQVLERMRELRHQRQWKTIIEEFGDEDFSSWPSECRGKAASAFHWRGRAYNIRKDTQKAEADLEKAVEISPRNPLFLKDLASHYSAQKNPKAESLYHKAYEVTLRADGGRTYNNVPYGATVELAELLTNQGRYEEAIEVLDRYYDDGKLAERITGYWRGVFLRARAQVYLGQGRDTEALTQLEAARAKK